MAATADRFGAHVVREARIPKGPTGLWAALTRTAATPALPAAPALADLPATSWAPLPQDDGTVVELASVAHLRYLARLAPARPDGEAQVFDLADERARRSA